MASNLSDSPRAEDPMTRSGCLRIELLLGGGSEVDQIGQLHVPSTTSVKNHLAANRNSGPPPGAVVFVQPASGPALDPRPGHHPCARPPSMKRRSSGHPRHEGQRPVVSWRNETRCCCCGCAGVRCCDRSRRRCHCCCSKNRPESHGRPPARNATLAKRRRRKPLVSPCAACAIHAATERDTPFISI
jgi:hypothetical protein